MRVRVSALEATENSIKFLKRFPQAVGPISTSTALKDRVSTWKTQNITRPTTNLYRRRLKQLSSLRPRRKTRPAGQFLARRPKKRHRPS